jgi:hypothetical protein
VIPKIFREEAGAGKESGEFARMVSSSTRRETQEEDASLNKQSRQGV